MLWNTTYWKHVSINKIFFIDYLTTKGKFEVTPIWPPFHLQGYKRSWFAAMPSYFSPSHTSGNDCTSHFFFQETCTCTFVPIVRGARFHCVWIWTLGQMQPWVPSTSHDNPEQFNGIYDFLNAKLLTTSPLLSHIKAKRVASNPSHKQLKKKKKHHWVLVATPNISISLFPS